MNISSGLGRLLGLILTLAFAVSGTFTVYGSGQNHSAATQTQPLPLYLPVVLFWGPNHSTGRVSIASDGSQGDGDSYYGSVSADGRYIAFTSKANNLVPGDTNFQEDIFVHDRHLGVTVRASESSDGAQADNYSSFPSISADGRYVAFSSLAGNLISDDTNAKEDVFVHDRATGVIQRVSIASDGSQGNDSSYKPALSADGRYVAFMSIASNLVAGDSTPFWDVFVHDRQTGETVRVSVASDGTPGNHVSGGASITPDGRHVAFASVASNLVADDTNNSEDVFVHDRETGLTRRISVASDGSQGNYPSGGGSISAGGRFVAFTSYATNLVSGDTNEQPDIFIYDLLTGVTQRISVDSNGLQANEGSYDPSISDDGRMVAFRSHASNLVSGDSNDQPDIFVHDLLTGATQRISIASDGAQANGHSAHPSISAGGRYVTFLSWASNLSPGDTNGAFDTFLYDRELTAGR